MHRGFPYYNRYPPGEKGHYKRQRTQVLKKLEKGVDKRREAWYSNQAVAAVSTAAERKWKKYLTATARCGNIKKLPRLTRKRKTKNFEKSSWQSFASVVNLKSCCWYENGSGVKKLRKKFLTNEMKFSIIAMIRRERRVPCKLNNVTKRKHQTDAWMVRDHQESEPRGSEPG